MDNPGFRILREAFQHFADKHGDADITGRLVRSLAAGGKAAVDKAQEEFPKTFVKQVVGDFYALLSSQEVADGISSTVRNLDEEKVKDLVDRVISQLKEDETALKVAKGLKDALQKTSTDDLENALDAALSNRGLGERMIAKAFFEQARPIIDEMRDASEEDIAEKIKELADTIPSDAIAQQVAALTREVTPERVSQQAHKFVASCRPPLRFPRSCTTSAKRLATSSTNSAKPATSRTQAPSCKSSAMKPAASSSVPSRTTMPPKRPSSATKAVTSTFNHV